MNSMKLLEQFLQKKYPDMSKTLSESDRIFLSQYSIDRQQSNSVQLLKKLGLSTSFDQYFRENEAARIIRDDIQNIYRRFTVKLDGNHDSFGRKFASFFDWWISEMDEDGKHHCCYCGVDEDTVRAAFNQGIIASKKPSFSGHLQIERMDPDGGYNPDNCKFACVICNNAKSDMISRDDFVQYFAPGIRQYWQHIKNKCLEKD